MEMRPGPWYTKKYRIVKLETDWQCQERCLFFFWIDIGFGAFRTKKQAVEYIQACIKFDLSGRARGTLPGPDE